MRNNQGRTARLCASLVIGFAALFTAVASAETFQEAVILSLNKDPRISAAVAAAKAEEARVEQIRTTGRPQISGSINAQGDGQGSSTSTGIARIELSQELYSFGRLSSSIEAAQERVTLAWIEVARTNQDVFADVSLAYANVLQADALVAIRRAFRDEMLDRMDAIEERIAAGLAGITEFQALGRVMADAEVALLMADQEATIARLELERLTTKYIDRVSQSKLFAYLRFLPKSEAESKRLAHANSPESHVSEQRFHIVEAEIEAQARANNPSLEAYGSYDYGINSGVDVNDGQIGIRLTVPIYQGGLRNAVSQEGAQSRQEALRLRQQDELLIKQSAAVAWASVGIAKRARGVWQRTMNLQLERIEAVQNEVDADLTPVDQLIQARSDMVDTRAELVRAQYDVVRAQLVLLRTVGLSTPAANL